MAWGLIAISAAGFLGLSGLAWTGSLGLKAMLLLAVTAATYFVGRSKLPAARRGGPDGFAKIAFTVAGCMALLRHRVEVGKAADGTPEYLPVYDAIVNYIDQVDGQTFVTFALVAMAVKFIGVISSAYGWHLLLVGQGVRFPFWSKIMTSFLIGRFIGTFLPSTIGLDGYTLYDAGKYSNQWTRAITAKTLEKFVGVTGLFLGMLLTMPFGYQVLVDVMQKAGHPERAPLLAAFIVVFAGGVCAVVIIGLVWPFIIQLLMTLVERVGGLVLVGPLAKVKGKVLGVLGQFKGAVGSYRGKVGLLMGVLFAKFVTHFTTAVVYYFTALAIGVTTAQFWPITFGSTIQILGTLFSPTIAGEGAREAFQSILLSEQLGGVAQSVLSAALGFIAAEAATLWGGAFMWVRKPGWRPAFTEVDGVQVDYAWINDADDTGFDADKLAKARAQAGAQG
ncbi:MAG: hypothetical protein JNM72_10105 [Deltaproteobacteria bacterium]|nr:hypothetical protein [Deltaproteobacteria bacterium]